MPDVISVVLCTYKRADKLPQCINALMAMNSVDGMRWELVCVDSNIDSESRRIIEAFASSSPVPIRYVSELDPRLSVARNAGLRHASGDILAYTDDDCLVDAEWLARIWNEMRADPSLAMLGGRLELQNKDDLPICIRPFRERVAISPTSMYSLIGTSNMAFRRSVVDAIGIFDPEFGPGTELPAAEDVDFVYRALKAGFKVVYSPDILIFHDHGRRTNIQRDKSVRAYVIARGAFYLKHIIGGDVQVLRLAYWESVNLVKNLIFKPEKDEPRLYAAKLLGYLFEGGLLYLYVRIRNLLGQSPSNDGFHTPGETVKP